MARDPTRFWRSGPPLRGGSLRPRLLLALGAAASRRFPPAPRLGSLHSLAASARSVPLARLGLGVAASRRVPPDPLVGSLHSLAPRLAPFRSRLWRSGPAPHWQPGSCSGSG